MIQTVAPAVVAAGIGALGGLLGGGKKKEKKPSPLYQTLQQIRAQRFAEQAMNTDLQRALKEQPGEIEAAIAAMRRRLERKREGLNA